MIADFCRLASSPQPQRPPRPPWPQSRPIVVVIAVRGRFRKEGRFLKLVACGHDATEERGREEVPHTNRTHAHAPTPPAKPRPARASERRRERARPQYPTTPPLHLAARSGNPPPPLLLRPDALQSVVARRCSARDLNVRTEGVLRKSVHCGTPCRLRRSFPFHIFPALTDFAVGNGTISDPHQAKK